MGFSAWIQSEIGKECFIPIVGMIPGKIYQVKHQVLEGEKKLELKVKINFQTEKLSTQFVTTPIDASEPKDRAYYVLADNHGINNFVIPLHQKLCFSEAPSVKVPESSVLTAYGHPLLSFTSALEAKDPSYVESLFRERRAKIVSSNGQHVVTLSSGVCDWNFTGYKANTSGLSMDEMLEQMKLKSNANRVSVQTFNQ